ncbi:MAG: AAA family ATPase [Candidatus Scalindua sp.]
MILSHIHIDNLYGISEKVDIPIKSFNVMVGRNDVGKSIILKALDLFLNNKSPSTDVSNLGTQNSIVTIDLIFNPDDREIVIDEAIPTTFKDEELLDENDKLRIRREWDVSKSKLAPNTSIYRKKYVDDDFMLLPEGKLIKLCEKHELPTRKANNEEYNNVEKRRKLQDYFELQNIGYEYLWEKLPPTGSSRGKLINDAIKRILPRFEYFKADSSLSEADSAIQNYFRDIAHTAMKGAGMGDVEALVKESLLAVLGKITEKINKVVSSSDIVEPDVEFDWSKVVKTGFKTHGEVENVPLGLRGDGFRRITMMAYFEHLAEENKTDNSHMIFGFEEPETFLHPSAQEQLFEKLYDLTNTGYQVFISTHSPIIVASTNPNDLIHVTRVSKNSVYHANIADLNEIASDIGINVDNQFVHLFDKAKVLLLVEGIGDAIALNYVSRVFKENGQIESTFEEKGIVTLPIGGCDSIKHWVTLDLLKKLSKPYFIYLDSDKQTQDGDSPNKAKLEKYGFVEKADFLVSRKRTLENYIPCDALNRIVPDANIEYGDFDDVKQLCRTHQMAGRLGGRNVAERHFDKLTFEELNASYQFDGGNEFIDIYNAVNNKF